MATEDVNERRKPETEHPWERMRRKEGRGRVCRCQGSRSGSACISVARRRKRGPISPRTGRNQHPATTITASGRIITAALFCSVHWGMSDEVIRMLSSDWLMRGSSRRRGRSLRVSSGTAWNCPQSFKVGKKKDVKKFQHSLMLFWWIKWIFWLITACSLNWQRLAG